MKQGNRENLSKHHILRRHHHLKHSVHELCMYPIVMVTLYYSSHDIAYSEYLFAIEPILDKQHYFLDHQGRALMARILFDYYAFHTITNI